MYQNLPAAFFGSNIVLNDKVLQLQICFCFLKDKTRFFILLFQLAIRIIHMPF